jgi:hypothetical protein
MAGQRCSAPKSSAVKGYARTAPRKKHKPASWWECYHGSMSCGVHHGSQSASDRHCRRLDKAERRKGRRAGWHPRHRTR